MRKDKNAVFNKDSRDYQMKLDNLWIYWYKEVK